MDVREKLWRIVKEAIHSWESDVNMSDHITDNLIAHGVTVQEWISVKDSLPEREQEVIVYTGNVLKPSVITYHFWEADMDSWTRVTHWMPLPQQPKGE